MACRRLALAHCVYDRVCQCFVPRVFAMHLGNGTDIRRLPHFDSDTIAFTNAALLNDYLDLTAIVEIYDVTSCMTVSIKHCGQ